MCIIHTFFAKNVFKIQRLYDPQNPLFHEQLLILYANNASCTQLFGHTQEDVFPVTWAARKKDLSSPNKN